MREQSDDRNSFTKPRTTFDTLYKLALKEIRKKVNIQPSTALKIRELLKILAAADRPLRHIEITKRCMDNHYFQVRHNGGKIKSREAVKSFIRRYFPLLIDANILIKNEGENKGYELAYQILSLSPSSKDDLKKDEERWNYVESRKKNLFARHMDFIEAKNYFDITGKTFLIPSILFINFELRKEVEKLKLFVQKTRGNTWILSKLSQLLEKNGKIYIEIFKTGRRTSEIDSLSEEIEEFMDKVKYMQLESPGGES